jgi:hypothetical protein
MDANPSQEESVSLPSSSVSKAPKEPLDDLLTLMGGNESSCTATTNSSSSRNAVRSAVVTPSHHPQTLSSSRPSSSSSSSSSSSKRQPSEEDETGASSESKSMEAGIDDRLGIRMLNRNVSSVDLLDMITTNPYHSPATICAMSLARLSQLLMDPPRILDVATVCGKTHLLTVGIVFSNTGTRISSKGGAFCVLTIGNFAAGPCVSVLLFGDVYSKNCSSCGPGKVVALLNPKLIPPREGGGAGGKSNTTTVSFTVHDSRQFLMVAKARDYGTCQATVSVKQPDGKWTANGKCKNYIDRRQCQQYCDVHRNHQQKMALGPSLNNKRTQKNGMTFVQQLRSEFQLPQPPRITTTPLSYTSTYKNHNSNNNFLVANHPSDGGAHSNPYLKPKSSASVNFAGGQQAVPMHMKRQIQTTPHNHVIQKRASENAVDALRKREGLGHHPTSAPATGTATERSIALGIIGPNSSNNWLVTGTNKRRMPHSAIASSSTTNTTTRRSKASRASINTSGVGFDGSVAVPKPSTLFPSRTPMVAARPTPSYVVEESPVALAAGIRQHQLDLARRLKEQQQESSSSATTSRNALSNAYTGRGAAVCAAAKQMTKSKTSATTSGGAGTSFATSFFGTMGTQDLERVRTTKSRFANEADAEDYAKSRQAVLELEKLENSKAHQKSSRKENAKFTKEWTCATCGGKKFSLKPNNCIAASHKVKRHLLLNKEETKADKRSQLQQKSSEDGGLRLGAGLEWSRPPTWSRFS